MSDQAPSKRARLSGGRQKELRRWLGLPLPQFAEMTPESTATHSRREQQDTPLTGPTGALVLVLDYLYELQEGAESEKVKELRGLLATDPTRRHFIGRFGAAALMQMMQEGGLPFESLSKRVQAWCEMDHKRTVERATTAQLQKTVGLSGLAIGGLVAAAFAGISWAWLQGYFSSPVQRKEKTRPGVPTSDKASRLQSRKKEKGKDYVVQEKTP